MCVLGKGPRLQRYVTQGGHASECYGALQGVVGGQNRKFFSYVFFERPLKLTECKNGIQLIRVNSLKTGL